MINKILTYIGLLITILTFVPSASAASLNDLNNSISKAQSYYEGLYVDTSQGALINEYYSSPKHLYTIRHGGAGAIFYYSYTHNASRSAELAKFFVTQNQTFDPSNDLHSYIWKTNDSGKEDLYSISPYYDCNMNLPTIGDEIPYKSKVCKLGFAGQLFYIELTKMDVLVPTMQQLQRLESGKQVDTNEVKDLEKKFDNLGFGMPMCLLFYCSNSASTIRTAEFGDLELRLHNWKYADKVADQLLKIQDSSGAVHLAYNKDYNSVDIRNAIYTLADKVLNDEPIYTKDIPSNAETMNDTLAFLLQYRCAKYSVCL